MKAKIFVISGQSGVGKNTVLKETLKSFPDFHQYLTCTTRPPRPHEVDGKDYYFLSEEEFKKRIRNNGFLEHAHVHDWYYGTPIDQFENAQKNGQNLIMAIDVQGAKRVKEMYPEAILIFIRYEDGDIEKLVRNRIEHDKERKVSEKDIETRINSAKKEAEYIKYYDYSVVNPEGNLQKAVNEVTGIINKELAK